MRAFDTMSALDAAQCIRHAIQVDPTRGAQWHEAFAVHAATLGYDSSAKPDDGPEIAPPAVEV